MSSKKSISSHKKKSHKLPSQRSRFAIVMKLLGVLLLLLLVVVGFYYLWALTFDISKNDQMSQRSLIYDRSGTVYSLAGGENREIVPFDRVSNSFVNALISREDARFYDHHGIDPVGIARATARNLLLGGVRQGGSTITQQLARNSFPLGGHNMNRKLLEAAMAFRIETELSKEKILELYMNRIYFGPGLYGVEAASQAYFHRPAAEMTLSQAALLAGLIRSPNRLSPYNNLSGALEQRDVVLNRMEELGLITSKEHRQALREKITPPAGRPRNVQNSWAVDAILHELYQVLPPDNLDIGLLHIYTTIDPGLQRAAEKALATHLSQIEKQTPPEKKHHKTPHLPSPEETVPLQGAILALDNTSGGITAIVGGRDYSSSQFNRALVAQRQIGSVAKPFVYAEAFHQGMSPKSLISDASLTPEELPTGFKNYHPHNSDHIFGARLPAREGLIHSRNTMTVRVGLGAGLENIARLMERLGLAEKISPYPSVCLGSFGSTLRNLTAAYTALATGGERLQPYLIEQVTNAEGKIIYQATRGRQPVLDSSAARTTTELLMEVMTHGTGSRATALGLNKPAAGKTGTTDHFMDAWFLGYTEGLTCGVWVGYDQPKAIMRGGYGSQVALPIWVDVMASPAASRYPSGELIGR